jgi:hypothetical protein
MAKEKSILSTEIRPSERKSFDRETGRWYVRRSSDTESSSQERIRLVYKMEGRGPTDVQLLGSIADVYMKGGALQDLCKRYKYWDKLALQKRLRELRQNIADVGGNQPPKLRWVNRKKQKAKKQTARKASPEVLLKASTKITENLQQFDQIYTQVQSQQPNLSDSEWRQRAAAEMKRRAGASSI